MEIINGILNLIAFVVIYLPLNFALMAGLTFIFRLANKTFSLHFPLWSVCTASAILVWVVMFAFTQSSKNAAPEYFLWASVIINLGVLLFIVFSDRVFTPYPNEMPFTWGKPQWTAIGVFVLLLLSVGLIPILNSASDVIKDYQNESFEKKLIKIIENNDTEAFKKCWDGPHNLVNYKLHNGSIGILEYLVQENKSEMVNAMYQLKPDINEFWHDFNIKTEEMIDVLVKNGVNSSSIMLPMIRHNNSFLIAYYIEKHKPIFDVSSDIVGKKLMEKQDTATLNYLIKKGMPFITE